MVVAGGVALILVLVGCGLGLVVVVFVFWVWFSGADVRVVHVVVWVFLGGDLG